MHVYISINETALYTYVRTWHTHGWHKGENVHGIQCLPAQTFYCILKQPSEPTASYTCNRRNNTIKFIISMYSTGKTQDGNRYTNTTRCWPCVKFLNSSVVVVQGRASLELVWPAHWTRTAGLPSSPLHGLREQVRLQVREVTDWVSINRSPSLHSCVQLAGVILSETGETYTSTTTLQLEWKEVIRLA